MTKLCFTVPGFHGDVGIFHGTGLLEVRACGREARVCCVYVGCFFFFFNSSGRSL